MSAPPISSFTDWLRESHPQYPLASVERVLTLAQEGATIVFMARYRKEQTGNLNEVQIEEILEMKERWEQILLRKAFILSEIDHQKKLTPELRAQIEACFQLAVLEDLYLPYKIKRQSRAETARAAGLGPLADWIWNCAHGTETPLEGQTLELWAFTFRNEAAGILDAPSAISGAQDILVERIAEVASLRQGVRAQLFDRGVLHTTRTKKAKEDSKFIHYFDFTESITQLSQPQNSHRYLAMKRGWNEEELQLHIQGPLDQADFQDELLKPFLTYASLDQDSPGREVCLKAAHLALKIHVQPAIETEIHKSLRTIADEAAIKVFAENLRKLLLAPPYGPQSVLGVDPGVRSGCKLAGVDASGQFQKTAVIYLQTDAQKITAQEVLLDWVRQANISAIAVGNGTAGRQAEAFIRKCLQNAQISIPVVMVSEAGASVYSGSEVARKEFPDLDLTVRGAISIARRLQDPLAELVKVDPKSIGVGQYQHDVSAPALKRSLTHVVEACVNQVGVNLNTASVHLLAYVSGIGPQLAASVVERRNRVGLYQSREELTQIERFGTKAFEQAAGFLRIPGGLNPLDNTGVHPEAYSKLERLVQQFGLEIRDLVGAPSARLSQPELQAQLRAELGELTSQDILEELARPGRDPRAEFSAFQFREDVHELADLKEGMILPGIVTNVTNFGAFVDVGVHQDGLVHISQISDQFVQDPRERVSPGDRVSVRVLEVNVKRNQIALTMKKPPAERAPFRVIAAVVPPALRPPVKPITPVIPPTVTPIGPPSSPGFKISPIIAAKAHKKPPITKREAFNNPFGGLLAMKKDLKAKLPQPK